jgi:predicted nucleotidyltransferase
VEKVVVRQLTCPLRFGCARRKTAAWGITCEFRDSHESIQYHWPWRPTMTALERVAASPIDVTAFCRRWKIQRMSLFGSVLRPDFSSASDVDVLVALRDDAALSLWAWTEMKDELQTLFSRNVDLVEESGLRNPFRRHEIMCTRQVIYAESAN